VTIGDVGRMLVVAGLSVAAIGAAFWALSHLTGAGRLPGDIIIRRRGFTFFFPVVTGLLASLILSVVATLLLRIFRR